MKTAGWILLLIVFFVILLIGYNQFSYTPYVPLFRYSDPDHAIEEKLSLLTDKHNKALQIILRQNNEKFYIKNDVLYIKKSLKQDVDLLSNYTMQAIFLEKRLNKD